MIEKIYTCGVILLSAAILSLIILMIFSLQFSFTARLLFKEPVAASGLALPIDPGDPFLTAPLRIVRQDASWITVSLPPRGQEVHINSSLLAGLLLPETTTAAAIQKR